jgi:two-component system NtrC family sensor kinase
MTGGFLISALFVRYLRKTLRTDETSPKWDTRLHYIFMFAIGMMIASIFLNRFQDIVNWVSHALLVYILYILLKEKVFLPVRSYAFALAPFAIASIVNDFFQDVFHKFYNKWDDYFEAAVIFSALWMILSFVMNRRQQQALTNERLKTAHEEEQNRIMASLKSDLEIQVAERTMEITRQKEALQVTLDELRATQSQLIQSEKMASLGELTAGIAHEIQNPLNFVNNFSEVSNELIDEMNEELIKGDIEEAKAIAADIKQNLDKINHHGKRADAIVKGMLQHSRSSTGQKEPTDINKLADEYFRLAYHGLRAKDKTFNATLKTDYDDSIGIISVVPQDLGRVILNLITNAFYAVTEKKKSFVSSIGTEKYEPTVTVTTKRITQSSVDGDHVVIIVKDNGNGIPQHTLDKIFQPFFTTKPTGQGTGLGLSMSYDIIVKGHGGEIKATTQDGEGAEFTVLLPAKNVITVV